MRNEVKYTMNARIDVRKAGIFILALFVMFLPQRIKFGVYSFRLIESLLLVMVLYMCQGQVRMVSFFKRYTVIFYFIAIGLAYMVSMEIASLIGFYLDSIILVLIVVNLINKREDFDLFIYFFDIALFAYCILGIVESVTGFNLWNVFTSNPVEFGMRYGLHRVTGVFTTPINNGSFLLLSMSLLMFQIKNTELRQKKRSTSLMILVWINLIMTLSRGPILCAAVLWGIWLIKAGILKSIRKHLLMIILIGITCVCIFQIPSVKQAVFKFYVMFAAIFDESIATAYGSEFGSNMNGIGQRTDLYRWVWDALSDNKLFGTGPNSVFQYNFISNTGRLTEKTSLENEYLSRLFHFGIVGLGITIMYYLSIFFSMLKKCISGRNSPIIKSYFFYVTSALLCYFIVGFMVSFVDEMRMLYILIGLGFSLERIEQSNLIDVNKNAYKCEEIKYDR